MPRFSLKLTPKGMFPSKLFLESNFFNIKSQLRQQKVRFPFVVVFQGVNKTGQTTGIRLLSRLVALMLISGIVRMLLLVKSQILNPVKDKTGLDYDYYDAGNLQQLPRGGGVLGKEQCSAQQGEEQSFLNLSQCFWCTVISPH